MSRAEELDCAGRARRVMGRIREYGEPPTGSVFEVSLGQPGLQLVEMWFRRELEDVADAAAAITDARRDWFEAMGEPAMDGEIDELVRELATY